MNNKKYGLLLATSVAKYLVNQEVGYIHRDYCGTGFTLYEGTYYHTHFYDGFADINKLFDTNNPRSGGIIHTFKTKVAFINWLAEQTDQSLSGSETNDDWYTDNQRITLRRLNDLFLS